MEGFVGMVTVGIDIGIAGGIAVAWWGDGLLPAKLEAAPMPIEQAGGKGRKATHAAGIYAFLAPRVLPALVEWRSTAKGTGGIVAVFERVHAMPGQGTASMFSFGRSAGMVEGVLVTMGLPIWPVEPARWKRDMEVTADKRAAQAKAAKLLPAFAHQWARAKDDGVAEAAMLALWARWHAMGKR